MKNLSVIWLIFTCFLFLGCSKQEILSEITKTGTISETNNQISVSSLSIYENDNNNIFFDKKLWIKFEYSFNDYKWKLETKDNQIIYNYPDWWEGILWNKYKYISIYTKKENQTIEDSIFDIIKNKWKDIKNCKVILKEEQYRGNPKYSVYVLDLANSKITYSKKELEEIKKADEEAKKDWGPFDWELKKKEIYNKRLIEKCSEYADPQGLWTSKTLPSQFIFNNKNKFIFLPASWEPPFFKEETVEFIEGE